MRSASSLLLPMSEGMPIRSERSAARYWPVCRSVLDRSRALAVLSRRRSNLLPKRRRPLPRQKGLQTARSSPIKPSFKTTSLVTGEILGQQARASIKRKRMRFLRVPFLPELFKRRGQMEILSDSIQQLMSLASSLAAETFGLSICPIQQFTERDLTWIISMPNKSSFMCPVCGYAALSEPPYDSFGCASYSICPCCGTEFGYDDSEASHSTLRNTWIARGMKWWSAYVARPDNWSAPQQLKDAGLAK